VAIGLDSGRDESTSAVVRADLPPAPPPIAYRMYYRHVAANSLAFSHNHKLMR
jgi:hypothetical protein